MSESTPDQVLYEVYNNARGIGDGAIVSLAEWKRYYRDLGGWFTYWGRQIDLSLKKVGGGIYRMQGTFK